MTDLRRSVLFFAVSFLQALDNQLVPVLMPVLRTQVGSAPAGWLLTAYAIACGVVPFIVASRGGENLRRLGVAALVVLAAGALTFSATTSFPLWLAMRAAAGGASGVLSMTLLLAAARIEDPRSRARQFTVITAGQLTALVAGIPIVAPLSWTHTYVAIGALCLLFAALIGYLAPGPVAGAIPARRLPLREVFSNRQAALVLLATGVVGAVMAGPVGSLSTFLSHERGFSMSAVGAVYMWSGVGPLIAMPIAGRLGGHWPPRRIAIAGSLLIVAPLCVFPELATTVAVAAILMLACVFIETLRRAALQGALADVVRRPDLPRYLAFRGVILQLGLAVGYAVGDATFTTLGFGFVCRLAALLSVVAAFILVLARAPAAVGTPQHPS
jgi:predicted MFS family arabinose efflux permease